MKTVSVPLEQHLGAEVTTLATLWLVTRADGQTFGFTDHDRDLEYGGRVYAATAGFNPSNVATQSDFAVDDLEAQGALSPGGVTELDIAVGRWDGAAVRVFQVNWADLSQGELKVRKGELGEISLNGLGGFVAELRGMKDRLQRAITREYLPGCDADLGDARCGVALGPLTEIGTVSVASSASALTATGLTSTADWFKYGHLTWLTGLNAGLEVEVKTYPGAGVMTLRFAMPFAIVVGDTFSVSPGCDKTKATCIAKFNNVLNHRGFDTVPGMDEMLQPGGV